MSYTLRLRRLVGAATGGPFRISGPLLRYERADVPRGTRVTAPLHHRVDGAEGLRIESVVHAVPEPGRAPLPDAVQVVTGQNSSLATVWPRHALILVDAARWRSLEPVERLHVLMHELAHWWYADEAACDVFAATVLRGLGVPPGAVIAASARTLGLRGCARTDAVMYVV